VLSATRVIRDPCYPRPVLSATRVIRDPCYPRPVLSATRVIREIFESWMVMVMPMIFFATPLISFGE
jgi:hypothetical protein